jgi:DNA adenine methylase
MEIMTNMMDLFEELDRQSDSPEEDKTRDKIIRAPFGYPGGKSKIAAMIINRLPYRNKYIEPFGGSGAILLARKPCKLDVLNDRYAGVVAFYRCLRDSKKYQKLIDYLKLTIHSREDFIDAKQTWCQETDDVIRAAKWYYMINYSFASLGRNFGRSTSSRGNMAGKIRNKLKLFPFIHERLKKVQIENQDWYNCIRDYDSRDTVFYLDPPYVDVYQGTFMHEMSHDEHRQMLKIIFTLDGFVAVSGYSNPLYENQDWDSRHEFPSYVSINSCASTTSNHRKCLTKREKVSEVLWIKE